MSATRLLFYTNKAATGWAALVRRNCSAPALPYCAALARRIGTSPALPYCAALARRNGTAPALPSASPSPYCISFFIGLRHMSSNGRRAFLLDRIASGLEAEGFPYTEALDKTINEFFNENLGFREFLNENVEDVDQGSEGEMQKVKYSELDKIQSKLQSFKTVAVATSSLKLDGTKMENRFVEVERCRMDTQRKRKSEFLTELKKVDGCLSAYIGNLSWEVTEDDIRDCFEASKIVSVRFAGNRKTGRFRFCHIDFEDDESLENAIKKNQAELHGRPMKIVYAVCNRN